MSSLQTSRKRWNNEKMAFLIIVRVKHHWISWSDRLPVTQKATGSSPVWCAKCGMKKGVATLETVSSCGYH